jgi:hypothetical protein
MRLLRLMGCMLRKRNERTCAGISAGWKMTPYGADEAKVRAGDIGNHRGRDTQYGREWNLGEKRNIDAVFPINLHAQHEYADMRKYIIHLCSET